MKSYIGPGRKTKFRPCRGDVPKRTVLYSPWDAPTTIVTVAYGERLDGLVIKSRPARGAVVRSGVGTAHHLRRFPVVITTTSQNHVGERLTRFAEWLKKKFPESKPKLENENRIRVVLWADEAKFVREHVVGNYRVRED